MALEAIRQFAGLLWTDPFDFQAFETQFREQQRIINLQQTLASERAAQKSRLEVSLYQQRGEEYRSEQIMHRAGQEQREIQRALNETSKLHDPLANTNKERMFSLMTGLSLRAPASGITRQVVGLQL